MIYESVGAVKDTSCKLDKTDSDWVVIQSALKSLFEFNDFEMI